MGQLRPTKLDIHRERDPRTASAKRAARAGYQRVLERVLRKHFPDWSLFQLNTAMDLEKSFGPIHCWGIIKHGISAFAVLGLNRQELQAPSTPPSPSESQGWIHVATRIPPSWWSKA